MPDPPYAQDHAEAKQRRQAQANEKDAAGKAQPGIDEHEAGGSGLSG